MGENECAEVLGLLVKCPDCWAEIKVPVSFWGCADGTHRKSVECPECGMKVEAGYTSMGMPFARFKKEPR